MLSKVQLTNQATYDGEYHFSVKLVMINPAPFVDSSLEFVSNLLFASFFSPPSTLSSVPSGTRGFSERPYWLDRGRGRSKRR